MKEKFDFDLACGNNFVYKNLHASIVCVPTVLVFWCAINAWLKCLLQNNPNDYDCQSIKTASIWVVIDII